MAVLSGRNSTATRDLRYAAALVAAAMSLLFPGNPCRAAGMRPDPEAQVKAAQVKAAFILNFARFVEWPPHAVGSSPRDLVIGILGKDPFDKVIDDIINGKIIDNRPAHVVRVGDATAAAACDVLFISSSERERLPIILRELDSKPVLTVSDMENFVSQGGMIGLKKRQDMIRFEINRPAAEAAHLRVSSKLLKLADNSPAK